MQPGKSRNPTYCPAALGLMLAVAISALGGACRPDRARRSLSTASFVTLTTIVWKPDPDHAPDPAVIGDTATLTVVVGETGRIESCTLHRTTKRSYRCFDGLPALPVTPTGPDNVVTVGWPSGETGYGVVLNGVSIDRVSERFDGLSQGHFRIVDSSGRLQ